MSTLTMSGAIVPDKERLGDFLRIKITVDPDVEDRMLAGISDEKRQEMRKRMIDILATAGVQIRSVIRDVP